MSASDIKKANSRMEKRLAGALRATGARFEAPCSKIVNDFGDGIEFSFPLNKAQGLDGATVAALSEIEVSPAGLGLHWPQLDVDLYIPALLQGVFGTESWMAQTMGK